MLVYKGINIFPEQFRTVLSMFDELSGRFKLRIKKEDNNLVSKIVIVCEKAMASNPDIYQLEKQIKIKIKEALSINPEVIIVNGFNIEGNKLKIIDYI